MDELKQQQIEALQTAIPYCERVSTALNTIIEEYRGNKQEDTDEYLKGILNGINWIFQVYNGTEALLNENDSKINKDDVNKYVVELNNANKVSDDNAKADALEGIRTFVDMFKGEAENLSR